MTRRRKEPTDADLGQQPDYLVKFARRSAPVAWSPNELEGLSVDDELIPVLVAASAVESETRLEVEKARLAGLMRSADLRQFLDLWIIEEDEHGRALSYAVGANRWEAAAVTDRDRAVFERFRRQLAPTALYASRLLPGADVAFLGVGVAAEFVTQTLYRYLAGAVESRPLKQLLHRIAAQESRHKDFFLSAGLARSIPSEPYFSALRLGLRRTWKPVGMDRLGINSWNAIFSPIINAPGVREELEGLDRVLGELELFRGLNLMGRFLDSEGYS